MVCFSVGPSISLNLEMELRKTRKRVCDQKCHKIFSKSSIAFGKGGNVHVEIRSFVWVY